MLDSGRHRFISCSGNSWLLNLAMNMELPDVRCISLLTGLWERFAVGAL